MASGLSGFTDWLDELLAESAQAAGEDVPDYIARAVAAQLVGDRRRSSDPVLDELRAHLAESPVLAAAVMPDVTDVLTDGDRLLAVAATGLLDTPPDENYDRITRAAAQALETPVAGLAIVDANRQFLKSVVGGAPDQPRDTPLELAICPYTVAGGSFLAVPDARADTVFKFHPAVLRSTVVAYLGVPLKNPDGHVVGTLFVTDVMPRRWSAGHIGILGDFAAIAAERIFAASADAPL